MTPASVTKRLSCATCMRPQSTCICRWITPIAHGVEVIILQHPLEVGNAKGSAQLLHWSLPHSRMVTGEVFAAQELQAFLIAPLQPQTATHSQKHAILLYPDTPQDKTLGMPAPPVLAPALLRDPSQLRLIVLDGTWRKSRKMLYQNPLLQQLPRLALRDMPTSHYLIRKAHRPDQLSTLEATCAALTQLEGRMEKFAPLLTAFDGFVAQQLGYQAPASASASMTIGRKCRT
ncbi:MAG: tRNA-uridine aminocarboxypropyltransferase [Burkholderiaceae bacterium]|nr:tRNA-uridine aminocarboxypropyltransferase [Burkholderiaceae bacterium]